MTRVLVVLATVVLTASCALCEEAPEMEIPPRPSADQWTNYAPEMPDEAIQRANDEFPLSDQDNAGQWVRYEPMWDEFDGEALDPEKWHDHNPGWLGRQPAFFSKDNVKVAEGCLQLTMRVGEDPAAPEGQGYHTFTSAAVKSLGTVKYGYFEVRAKPMRSHGSSAFWFYDAAEGWWTEIDVFEIGGGAPAYARKLFMTQHVFYTPAEDGHWSVGAIWDAPFDLADDFHVYGLEWDEREVRFYFDGVMVRSGPNTHWVRPLTMNFDSETMPEWFGLPLEQDLPSTYLVDYVRSWKHSDTVAPSPQAPE